MKYRKHYLDGFTECSIDEMINIIQKEGYNCYKGGDLLEYRTILYNNDSENILPYIQIIYDDMIECKMFEMEIRPTFYYVKSMKWDKGSSKPKQIRMSYDCKSRLEEMKFDNESFEDLLWRLILNY